MKLTEGDSVQDHIKGMTEVFNELSVIGAEMDEEDRVVLINFIWLKYYKFL